MLMSRESHKKIFATPVDKRTHRDTIRDPSTGNGIEPIAGQSKANTSASAASGCRRFFQGTRWFAIVSS
jgi:hypothetical protein